MTRSESSALAHFINSNSDRFQAMALELPAECRVLVVDGAKRNHKGYGLAFEPVIHIEQHLRQVASALTGFPDEYVSLLTRWYIVHHSQKAEAKRSLLQEALLPALSVWQRSLLEYCHEARCGAQEVCVATKHIRENSRMMRQEAQGRLAQIRETVQQNRNRSSAVLASSYRCLQEIDRVLAAKGSPLSPGKHRHYPAGFPESGRRRCFVPAARFAPGG